MDISIIIPAINEVRQIQRAVKRAHETGACEVIVVDGGSRDGTQDVAVAEGCILLECPPGRARQQNRGARGAVGDVLLFQHADSWLDPASVKQITAAMTDDGMVSGAFRQHIEAEGLEYRWLERGNAWRARMRGLPYGDQGIFVRRETFFELGPFAEVPILEDLILARALRRRAWPVLLPGPIHVDPRRWRRHGIVRQTLRNWSLVTAYRLGASPERLASYYVRHDT